MTNMEWMMMVLVLVAFSGVLGIGKQLVEIEKGIRQTNKNLATIAEEIRTRVPI